MWSISSVSGRLFHLYIQQHSQVYAMLFSSIALFRCLVFSLPSSTGLYVRISSIGFLAVSEGLFFL